MVGNDFGKVEVILLFIELEAFDVVCVRYCVVFGRNLFEIYFLLYLAPVTTMVVNTFQGNNVDFEMSLRISVFITFIGNLSVIFAAIFKAKKRVKENMHLYIPIRFLIDFDN